MLPLNGFLSFIARNRLFKPTDKILIALSGGKDSVLMTHLFNEAGFNFGIAHCNFQLRDEESDADEAFTKRLAQKLNASYFRTSFDTLNFAKEHKISIQMAARQLRYYWFEEICLEHNFDYIALAHHKNDTTETILLNLIRGTGISGLHGILPKRDKIIRPLLFLERDEIDAYVKENAFEYREDSSNSSLKYVRNKIRLDVIPKLKELNPQLEDTFEKNSRRFIELERFLHIMTDQLRNNIFRFDSSGEATLNLKALQALYPQKLLLYELFKPYHFSEAVLEDLARSWHGQPGKIFSSVSHRLILDRNSLILSRLGQRYSAEKLINRNENQFNWGSIAFKFREVAIEEIKIRLDKDVAILDADLLHFPLKLRNWQIGDHFYPLGMKGKKKLSDFFTGLKLSVAEKERVSILANGNDDIIWIVGHRIDDRYKVTPQTKKVIIFEAKINDN